MGQKENGRQAFLFLIFLNFKLVPINSELNSASGNQIYLYQKIGCGTQKSSQTWKCRLKPKKNHLCDQKAQDGHVVGPNPLHIQDPRNCGSSIG